MEPTPWARLSRLAGQAAAFYWGLVDIIWTVVCVILYPPGRRS
jgi:heme/copper-type cytochrome/quinol oxidase subunit 3